jgi:hypothetical protein
MKEREEQPESLIYCLRNGDPDALRAREEIQPGKGEDTRPTLLDFMREKGRELLEEEARAEAEKTGEEKKSPVTRRQSDPAGPAFRRLLGRSTWQDWEEIGGKGWEAEFIALAFAGEQTREEGAGRREKKTRK